MNVQTKRMNELRKTTLNIRRHSEKQIKEYVRSLEMFGQIRPLVITDDGEILVGNGMYEALLSMGKESCDVYVVEGLSKAQKRKLMLADNKVYELGFTDIDVLDSILKDLDGDFDVPGYDADLLDTLVANPLKTEKSVGEYGTVNPDITKEVTREFVSAEQSRGEPQYAPPVKTSDGEFVKPEHQEERPYIICPKCGEKIWL